MQSTFNMLRPTMGAARALSVLKRLKDKDYVDSSLALELWLNDNVSFPGECYREMITALYRENSLVNDTLRLGGTRKVEFKSITCPILNVAASEDHIVPLDASRALAGLTSSEDYTELITPGGHIGAVISKKASAHLWPNMVMWLESRFMNEHSVANAANAQATATAAAAAAAVTAQTVEVTVQSRMGANAARGKILRGKGLRHSTEFKKAPILPQSEGPAGEPEVRTRIRPWQAPLT
jgi:poly(3-hydroxyalkanoate) synthetase